MLGGDFLYCVKECKVVGLLLMRFCFSLLVSALACKGVVGEVLAMVEDVDCCDGLVDGKFY